MPAPTRDTESRRSPTDVRADLDPQAKAVPTDGGSRVAWQSYYDGLPLTPARASSAAPLARPGQGFSRSVSPTRYAGAPRGDDGYRLASGSHRLDVRKLFR